jgi:hypothetical protein
VAPEEVRGARIDAARGLIVRAWLPALAVGLLGAMTLPAGSRYVQGIELY